MTWWTTIWIMLLVVSSGLWFSIGYSCGKADAERKLREKSSGG